MFKSAKSVAVLGTAVVAVGMAGIATAAWTANGSGTGSTKALTSVDSVVTADTATAQLYPGGPAGTVFFKITNPNPYAVTFNKITAMSVVSDVPASCASALASVPAASVASPYLLGTGISVPAGTTVAVARTIPGLVTLDHSAGDGCQGMTFTTTLTLLGSQD